MNQSFIRNFAIIAHIDHGKSTLADRLLEITGTVSMRDMVEQTLDSNPISRERGITIKLAPVCMSYTTSVTPSTEFQLNLIDTPGHVDFSYEVERSLAACEGAILLVDATQGIQAQTLSNYYKAKKLGLKIIPVINKIDSPIARVEETKKELLDLLSSLDEVEISMISAKSGQGVKELLERVIKEVPPPSGKTDSATRALVFSSLFDPKRGVVAFVRVVDGKIEDSGKVQMMATKSGGAILGIGKFRPGMTPDTEILTGEVGYVATNVKDPAVIKVGDTLTISSDQHPATSLASPLPGYLEPKPVVFVSFFPVDQDEFPLLEDGLRKLKLNDAAITFTQISSKALGRGFRCGFLGHLHAEVSQERLSDEFGLAIMATSPTVEFKTVGNDFEEPWVMATIIVPQTYVGAVISLCEDRRSKLLNMDYHGLNVTLVYEMPLAEIITDFFDQLKSRSSGFASMDYELDNYRPLDAVHLDILINHETIDAFSQIFPREKAEKYGKFLVEKLKEAIPRQQIPVPIQASVDGQIIARADIQAFRKDVGAKLYGGDFTRRLKLEQKQKKGKEKMKAIGKVNIPGDTFLKIFRT